VTKHRTPWVLGDVKLPAFDDVWELEYIKVLIARQ